MLTTKFEMLTAKKVRIDPIEDLWGYKFIFTIYRKLTIC